MKKKELSEIKTLGIELVIREVKLYKGQTSCTVLVPKEWEGKNVKVIRLE